MPLSPIKGIDLIEPLKTNMTQPESGMQFSQFLGEAVKSLENSQVEGDQATAALATGTVEDFHTPMIALEKANLTMGLAVTVRNKVLDTYQQIMSMQI